MLGVRDSAGFAEKARGMNAAPCIRHCQQTLLVGHT